MEDYRTVHTTETMVHFLKEEAFHVRSITGNVKRHDLTAAICQKLIPTTQALCDDRGHIRSVTLGDDILSGFIGLDRADQIFINGLLIDFWQWPAHNFKSANQKFLGFRVRNYVKVWRHYVSLLEGGSAVASLSHQSPNYLMAIRFN